MKERVISAIIALVIVIPIIIIGGLTFKIAVALIAAVGFWELARFKNEQRKTPILMRIIGLCSLLAVILSASNENGFTIDFKLITLIIFLTLIPLVFYHDNKKYNITDALFIIGSVFFLGIAFNYLIVVRAFDLDYLIFLLLITIFTDIFAYITGMLIGRHKMVPSISPKKTWEGFIGGTTLGVFISTVFYMSAFEYTGSILILILIITFLSIIGQMGDLVFSSIKRYYNKKDFSNIMPGHGGILDRLDSILFVMLAFSFIVYFL